MIKPTKGIAVDCSCINGNPGDCEFRGIDIQTKKILFSYKISGKCTNNIAEFLALVKGVQILLNENRWGEKVYTDSQTALSWYKKRKHKSKLIRNEKTETAIQQLNKAFDFIPKTNHMDFVEFWNNKTYGETPADYGRK